MRKLGLRVASSHFSHGLGVLAGLLATLLTGGPEYNCECVYAVCAHYSGHYQYLGSVNVIIIIIL